MNKKLVSMVMGMLFFSTSTLLLGVKLEDLQTFLKNQRVKCAATVGVTSALVVTLVLNQHHIMRPIIYNATTELLKNSATGALVGLGLGGVTYRYTEHLPIVAACAAGLWAVTLSGSLIQKSYNS